MKKVLLFLIIIFAFGYSCSDESGNGSGISDSAVSDLSAGRDHYSSDISSDTGDIKDEESDSGIAGDITLSDSEADTGQTDIADVSYEDITESDVTDTEDIIFTDVPEDTVSDISPSDIISDEIAADISTDTYDAGYEDTVLSDAGPLDFGTKRGLLFSAREKFKTKPSIFYADPEGGVPQKISPDLSDEFTRPFWAPDGNSFYFESSGKIYKTPFGKFEPEEVCSGMDFAVSPDEKLIALNKYVKINDLGEYDYELFIYNLETKKYTQITTFMDGEMENRPSSPSFSPDSKKILFSMLNPAGSYDVYSSDLFIYDIETKFLVNITNEAKKIQAKVANRSSEWSADQNKHGYLHILFPESGYYLVEGLAQPKRVSAETHNGIDGVAFSPNANAMAIAYGPGKGIKIIDLKGNLLYDLPIIDLEYIDNLSWK